jgi:hypothetical protein
MPAWVELIEDYFIRNIWAFSKLITGRLIQLLLQCDRDPVLFLWDVSMLLTVLPLSSLIAVQRRYRMLRRYHAETERGQ